MTSQQLDLPSTVDVARRLFRGRGKRRDDDFVECGACSMRYWKPVTAVLSRCPWCETPAKGAKG